MADAEQIARWRRVEDALRVALLDMRPSIDSDSADLVSDFLDHNELGVAMDTLVDAALRSQARDLPATAIDNMRSASAQMGG